MYLLMVKVMGEEPQNSSRILSSLRYNLGHITQKNLFTFIECLICVKHCAVWGIYNRQVNKQLQPNILFLVD